jgi:hypothetical protein
MTGRRLTDKAPIKPERELVEIGLKMLRAYAVMAVSQPAFQIAEDQMGDGQKVFGHPGIARRATGRCR